MAEQGLGERGKAADRCAEIAVAGWIDPIDERVVNDFVERILQLALRLHELHVTYAGEAAREGELMIIDDLPEKPASRHNDGFQTRPPTVHDRSWSRVADDRHRTGHEFLKPVVRERTCPGRVLGGAGWARLNEAVDLRRRLQCPCVDPANETVERMVIRPYRPEDEVSVVAAAHVRRADQ